ncbi:S41 family peptidase [Candidatus Poribacteria bacterium]|nr:S41 family peptidase [Candidatus Poribacteria bacterium]MYF55681.1 S41 family peptidase [Candidatus Poribacteria bacterium]MYI93948.1 S41 family peptidase [Candidatus Poribacteria bacterium]
MKRFTLSIIVLIIAIGLPLLIINSNERFATSDNAHISLKALNKALDDAIRTAEDNYYKPVDKNAMYHGAIKGALLALDDPYTFLLSQRDHKRSVENLYNAQFGGLGVSIYPDHRGFVKISKPMPGTPAESAQLQAGDYITRVNGKQIYLGERTGMTLDDVVDLLRGRVNTDVTITVQRKYLEPFDIRLKRAKISIPSVTSTMLDDGIGYIRISKFIGTDRAGGTEEEFNKALASHNNAGMQALILDLRNNHGGLLDAAYHIADAFIDNGVIVSTKGRNNSFNEQYPAHSDVLCDTDIPLVILVDEYSASASEIVAGAIKDTGRGILIGEKTYGKGVVQKRYPIRGIGAVSLTISSYYTPNGTSIDKSGISPHIPISTEPPDRIEQVMQRLVAEKNAIEDYVTDWIEDETKRTSELPKDFTRLEATLPQFRQELAADGFRVSLRWLTYRAEQLFNRNVGIEQIVNLRHDTQLQEAIRIITSDKVGDTLQLYKTLDDIMDHLGTELQSLTDISG